MRKCRKKSNKNVLFAPLLGIKRKYLYKAHSMSIRHSILSSMSLRVFSIFLAKLLFSPYDRHFITNTVLLFPTENLIHLSCMYHFNLEFIMVFKGLCV